MTVRAGRNVAMYLNGVDVSGDLNEITGKSEIDLGDITTATTGGTTTVGHVHWPGLYNDSVDYQGLLDDASLDTAVSLIQRETGYAAMILFGQTVGSPAVATNECMLKNLVTPAVVRDVNKIKFSLDVDNYPLEPCVVLAGKAQKTSSSVGSIYDTSKAGTLTNGTGIATGSPVTLVIGANTPTITQAGNFVINLKHGVTGTAATGGWTVATSPVSLVSGNNTITVSAGGSGTITITLASTGAVGYAQVFEQSGGTGVTLSIRHSTDNFAADDSELLTFGNFTASGALRVEATGSVKRYLRAKWVFAGGGSYTGTFAIVVHRL